VIGAVLAYTMALLIQVKTALKLALWVSIVITRRLQACLPVSRGWSTQEAGTDVTDKPAADKAEQG
jgi:hypothetical protein